MIKPEDIKFRDCHVRINSEYATQISVDNGETWEEMDFTDTIKDIRFKMGGQIPLKTNKFFEFSKIQDPTKW